MKKLILLSAILAPALSFAQLQDSAQRLVHMQGAINFRDAGGYTTSNGKHVAWGKVFRSAEISKLTDADLQTFNSKKIHSVIDFRGTKEAAAAPDRLPTGTPYLLCPAGSDSIPSMQQIAALIKSQSGFLTGMYGAPSVKYYGERYKPLFQQLLTMPDTAALLYHCTGGRDRTGMATALFLYALDVPMQTIEADFTASNVYLKPMHDQMFAGMSKAMGLTPEQVKKEMELRPELLQSFFGALKDSYGSVENFMDKELGVGPKELAILKAKYTF
ncbi:protein-tyrosine phosphatase [Filimonas lacunae]|uniref:Protein-tyrosine phosphatase n=1 Tax=Filimonas lacunae TaxID=477680 RepID=A0A173MDU3_9BACT|nr:tyrosine-protein phosphatase [Filimonas lacunae]BAV05649.1 protein-tyrosine-phosphatase [Filimonas lacunae]SIT29053.1 protein-tyrosine phosphatase [Filimonas lacunae]